MIILGIIIFLKLVLNASKFYQISRYLKKYEDYVKAVANKSEEDTWKYVQDQSSIISLLKGAEITDSRLPYVEDVASGYGGAFVRKGTFSIMENIFSVRADVVAVTTHMFNVAIGYYKARTLESVNPLYWLELIVFLPKKIMEHLNFQHDPTKKILQVIYWIIMLFFFVFENGIRQIIKSWFIR